MNIISQHLDINNLRLKIYDVDTICAFTGEKIQKGVLMKDLIKKTFTDYEQIKFDSKYASIDIALLIESVIPGEKRLNSIRNYSFYADNNQLLFLKRENILELLYNIPSIPFQLGVTYSNKKHIAYKAPINYSRKSFDIITDKGLIHFIPNQVKEIIKICQDWFTIIPGKEDTEAKPVLFSKTEIRGEKIPDVKSIQRYGVRKWFFENHILEKNRGTALFNFIIHILNKKQNEN